jgi:hypothetical protein
VNVSRLLLPAVLALALTATATGQIDQTHRRTAMIQSGTAVGDSEEAVGGVGYFLFNEAEYPWDNTVLRLIYAGVYADAELSTFLSSAETTAVGAGLDGGFFIDSVTPYVDGERLSRQSFYGDRAGVRLFVDQELAEFPLNETILVPVHLRGTYRVGGRFYRETSDTQNFEMPENILLQTLLAEFRIGAVRPRFPYREGFEIYLGLEANYRTGQEAFGPTTGLFDTSATYQRALASMGGEVPLGPVRVYGRVTGGTGDDIDEIAAWRVGGNLSHADTWSFPLHGYYTRELFAEDFGLANLELIVPVLEDAQLNLHFYGDYAAVRTVPPQDGEWHSFIGTGAGVSFTAWWQVRTLVNYGYGVTAVRNGDHGGHEIGLALQKEF